MLPEQAVSFVIRKFKKKNKKLPNQRQQGRVNVLPPCHAARVPLCSRALFTFPFTFLCPLASVESSLAVLSTGFSAGFSFQQPEPGLCSASSRGAGFCAVEGMKDTSVLTSQL